MRLLFRSATYTKPSLLTAMPWGVLNCGFGLFASYVHLVSSSGRLPYAPQCRLYLPVAASSTTTRRLPYPSEMKISLVGTYCATPVALFRFSVSLLAGLGRPT